MKLNLRKSSLLICIFLIFGAVFSGCSLKNGFSGNKVQPTMVPTTPVTQAPVSATPLPATDAPTPEPTKAATAIPVPSATATPTEAAPTDEPEPTAEPTATVTPSPTPIPYTAEECAAALIDKISDAYTLSEAVKRTISGDEYYAFTVSDENKTYQPTVIVGIYDKAIYYYYETGEIVELESFPIDNGEAGETGDNKGQLTETEIAAILKDIPAYQTGLALSADAYKWDIDEYTSIINIRGPEGPEGVECYGARAIDPEDAGHLCGIFYVSVDRVDVYRFDDIEGSFDLIK